MTWKQYTVVYEYGGIDFVLVTVAKKRGTKVVRARSKKEAREKVKPFLANYPDAQIISVE